MEGHQAAAAEEAAEKAAGVSWKDRAGKIAVGDKVDYKASFLRSTGQFTGSIPHARGIVTELKSLGDNLLATVDWNDPEIPAKVLACHLSKVTQRGIADD